MLENTMHTRKSSSPSSACIVIGNDDLLIEIFVLLPARSLIRFELVSKHWQSIISAPSFRRAHTLNHRRRCLDTQHSFILCRDMHTYFVCDPTVHKKIIPFDFGYPSVLILQSCNGLLLLRRRNTLYGRNYYCVFNPTLKQCRDLTLPNNHYVQGLCLMFDPSLSPDYRVIAFLLHENRTFYYVYTSEGREWKLGGECTKTGTSFRNGIYLNGGVNFVRAGSSSFRVIPDGAGISKIPDPPYRHRAGGRRWNYCWNVVSNGVLLCITIRLDPKMSSVFVRETKEIGEGWSWGYWGDMTPLVAAFGGDEVKNVKLLGVVRGETDQDTLLLLGLLFPMRIVVYRVSDAHFEVLVDDDKSLEFQINDGHAFVQSLADV